MKNLITYHKQKPPPGTLEDIVHKDVGKGKAAKTVKVYRMPDGSYTNNAITWCDAWGYVADNV